MGKASVKVPDGKLVKVETEATDVFENVNIRGDFFIDPAEALHELEEAVEGLEKESSREQIIENLEMVEADLIGFSREDIAEAVRKSRGDTE